MIRLSIIIPFYNVEKYIAECLDSVFDQDIPLDEYEVICVNDGSPDHSRDIVLDYMKRYPNLRLVEHDHNRKLGAARNTGRAAAKGTYIWNVDSDDKIAPKCLGEMLKVCEEKELDVLEFGVKQFDGDKETILEHVPETECVINGLDYMKDLTSYQISRMCPVWRKMIRREFLDKNNIYSPEINMGEDVPYSFTTLIKAQRLFVIDKVCYYYRLNPDSLTGKNWVPTAKTLYEKCVVEPYNIYSVAQLVPKGYPNVKKSFVDSAKYMFNVYNHYFCQMLPPEQHLYKKLLRQSLLHNRFVLQLLSCKAKIKYLFFLFF